MCGLVVENDVVVFGTVVQGHVFDCEAVRGNVWVLVVSKFGNGVFLCVRRNGVS